MAYERVPCQRPCNRAADALLVGIESYLRLAYSYRSDGAASEVKRCLGSLSFWQARHWFSVSSPLRRAVRKHAGMVGGMVGGTVVGIAVGVVSAGARRLASAGAIPMPTIRDRTTTRHLTMRDRLAAGRVRVCGETAIGHCGGRGAAGNRAGLVRRAEHNAPLARGIIGIVISTL